jgi:hypothetical protein
MTGEVGVGYCLATLLKPRLGETPYPSPEDPTRYWVPLRPTTITWQESGISLSRTQFFIQLAYALTIHKSQGSTLPLAVLTLSEAEHSPGLSYTGLSRVPGLSALALGAKVSLARMQKLNAGLPDKRADWEVRYRREM